ncbi:MAG: RNHCP domain-containing protein [Anaerolineales bacterium]|nr:RNHCP domain-containing protein [Anaerolineales bacterium]
MRSHLEWNADFRCQHCQAHVSTALGLCAVQNRNHCPYCLWSRHLDLYQAGDRLSACKAPMRPVGLTLKRSRNKYAHAGGELMLVHRCSGCGQHSLNRLAADDVPQALEEVFRASWQISPQERLLLSRQGIALLEQQHTPLVTRQLYGQTALLATTISG